MTTLTPLYLSSCHARDWPVITAACGTRESKMSREKALTQGESGCLSRGNKQTEMGDGNIARQCAPVEWRLGKKARSAPILRTL